jgi:glutathione S-transferase
LAAKKIEYQFCGMDLTEKNLWHTKINGGLVPILELQDGRYLLESDLICDYLQESTEDGLDLYPGDEANKFIEKNRMNKMAPIELDLINSYILHEERIGNGSEKYIEAIYLLNSFMPPTDYASPFISKTTMETMADLMILPFVHRAFLVANSSINNKYFEKVDFFKIQNLLRWYKALGSKYHDQLCKVKPFTKHLEKSIQANGPKIPLSYPYNDED